MRAIASLYSLDSLALLRARRVTRLLALIAMLLVPAGVADAQQPQQPPAPRIVVTGDGSVSVQPDHAQISIGATTRAKTVKEGVDANARLMAAILAALKNAGIAETDIQTTRLSIQPLYGSAMSGAEARLTGYSIANHVTATVHDIGAVGSVIDAAVAAGATDLSGISFLVSDPSKVLDQAREAAIADARRKAEVYAKASGVRVGDVEWITEDTSAAPPLPMMSRAASAPVPIATGEDTLRVRVTVAFAIAR